MYISESFLNSILEARKVNTMTRSTRASKLKRDAGAQGMAIARSKNDPMYKRYQKFRSKMFNVRDKLRAKYGARGMMAARKNI